VAKVTAGAIDESAIVEKARAEILAHLTASLVGLGSGGVPAESAAPTPASPVAAAADGYESVYIDTPECSACDECTTIAPKAFVYNDQKLAIVVNPQGAKFADFVKAAEKCTSGCLHPGTPWNMNEPGIEKLMARAAKYN